MSVLIGKKTEGRQCNHPTCGATCRREKKPKKIYRLKRTALKRSNVRPKKIADSRAKLDEIYTPLAADFCRANLVCQIKAPGCTYWTQGVNHKKGKVGKDKDGTPLLIKVEYFEGACNHCNEYCESHHQWAREQGHRISKYS